MNTQQTYIDGSLEAQARRERLDNARMTGWSNAPGEDMPVAEPATPAQAHSPLDDADLSSLAENGTRTERKLVFLIQELESHAQRLADALAIAYIWRQDSMPQDRKDMIESAIAQWEGDRQ